MQQHILITLNQLRKLSIITKTLKNKPKTEPCKHWMNWFIDLMILLLLPVITSNNIYLQLLQCKRCSILSSPESMTAVREQHHSPCNLHHAPPKSTTTTTSSSIAQHLPLQPAAPLYFSVFLHQSQKDLKGIPNTKQEVGETQPTTEVTDWNSQCERFQFFACRFWPPGFPSLLWGKIVTSRCITVQQNCRGPFGCSRSGRALIVW